MMAPYMQKLDTALSEELAVCRIVAKDTDPHCFRRNIKGSYIDAVVENLQCRFPDISVISAFGLFNPERIPDTASEQYRKYGNDQLHVLREHYGEFLDHAVLEQEWVYFKQLLAESFKNLTTREVLEMVVKDLSLQIILPQFGRLANIALTIPISTADCERGFSAVKRIKTLLRNQSKTHTLDCLMRISVEGPELDRFNFDSAATHWASLRNRRLKV